MHFRGQPASHSCLTLSTQQTTALRAQGQADVIDALQ